MLTQPQTICYLYKTIALLNLNKKILSVFIVLEIDIFLYNE